jgi:hypothetical protein
MYSVTAWFAARTATILPMEVMETALFCVLMYFMVGYYLNVVNFLVFLAGAVLAVRCRVICHRRLPCQAGTTCPAQLRV